MPSREKKAARAADGLVDALAQVSFATMAALNRLGAEHDLSLTQLRVLAILRERRLRVSELAAHLGLERSTLSGLIDRAEARGLVARGKSRDDGRAVDVHLTAKGAQLAARGGAQVREALAPMLVKLSAAEQKSARTLLEKLLEPKAT